METVHTEIMVPATTLQSPPGFFPAESCPALPPPHSLSINTVVASMDNNERRRRRKPHTEDRLGALTDDVLLSILGRVDLATAARTCALSARWRDLPWLLPSLNLRARDFLPDHPVAAAQLIECYRQIPAQRIDDGMAALTRAAGSFLRTGRSGKVVAKVSLEILLPGSYLCEIGPLLRDAIDNGTIKELVLAIADDKIPKDLEDADMPRRARNVDGFFSAYPSMLPLITRLQLCNLRFAEVDINRILFDCCKQLQHLSLENCDVGDCSVWQINAPSSSLRVLEICFSYLKRLEVLCLPKLERLSWDLWMHYEAPLHFGLVPSLNQLFLACGVDLDHPGFSLSQLLNGATDIHTLNLNFQGEKLWIQPERTQLLRPAFNKLRKLSIYGVYVEFDLLWTMNLLEAAPTVQIFDIEMFEHPCEKPDWECVGIESVQPSWKTCEFTSCNRWQLRELHFVNFSPLVENHFLFVRAMMDHAPNLTKIVLKEGDEELCKRCEAMGALPPPVGGIFPRDKDEQEKIAKQLRCNRVLSSAQIVFINGVSRAVF